MRKATITQALFALTVLLALSASASANITGYVYHVDGNYLDAKNYQSGQPGVHDEGSFTASAVNFFVQGPQGSAGTLYDFLTYGGADTTNVSAAALGELMSNCPNNVGSNCYSTAISIFGSAYFVHGASYTVTHDDGVILEIAGLNYLNLPAPVGPTPSTFTFNGGTGVYNYNLYYMGTNGNPEVLIFPTPEPSSMLLIGMGLLGLTTTIRHRIGR